MEDYSGLETDGKVKVDQRKTGEYYRLLMDSLGRATTKKDKENVQDDQSEDSIDEEDDVKNWSTGFTGDQFD